MSIHKNVLLVAMASSMALTQVVPSQIDQSVHKQMTERARETRASAFVVIHGGKTIANHRFDSEDIPLDAMSITKAVTGMAVGFLLTDGLIQSMDEPVSKFFPEWKQGQKQLITIRHILTHSSGLQTTDTDEIYAVPDALQQALCAEIVDKPGVKFKYNNKAVNIIPGLVQKITGKRMDVYLQEKLFKPLGIKNVYWLTDAFCYSKQDKEDLVNKIPEKLLGRTPLPLAGNVYGMAELMIRAEDLAKVGQFMLQKGMWNGSRLMREDFIEEATTKGAMGSNTIGLLWEITFDPSTTQAEVGEEHLKAIKEVGFPEPLVQEVSLLRGIHPTVATLLARMEGLESIKAFGGFQKFQAAVWKKGGRVYKWIVKDKVGFRHTGGNGQHLLVIPAKELVVVVMRRPSNDPGGLPFSDLVVLAMALVPSPVAK